jgi:hypothetical protein
MFYLTVVFSYASSEISYSCDVENPGTFGPRTEFFGTLGTDLFENHITRTIPGKVWRMGFLKHNPWLNIPCVLDCYCLHNFYDHAVYWVGRVILFSEKVGILKKPLVSCLIYYYYYYYFLWLCSPARGMASSFSRFRDHTQRRATVGRTPLDEWSARRRDLYLTTHTTNKLPYPRWYFNPPTP